MRVSRGAFSRRDGWVDRLTGVAAGTDVHLVLAFWPTNLLSDGAVRARIRGASPARQDDA
jgi:hypothetical protein